MKKFTVFTVILTVIIIVVVAEIVVNDYLPSLANKEEVGFELNLPEKLDLGKSIATNVFGGGDGAADIPLKNHLGADLGNVVGGVDLKVDSLTKGIETEPNFSSDILKISDVAVSAQEQGNFGSTAGEQFAYADKQKLPTSDRTAEPIELFTNASQKSGDGDFEKEQVPQVTDKSYALEKIGVASDLEDFEQPAADAEVQAPLTVYLTQEQAQNAGFVEAFLEKESDDGHLFKTILIDDLKNVEIDKYVIRSTSALLAKVYVFRADANGDLDEIYKLLKLRAAEGLNVEVNETNDFGAASFYLNDGRRASTAFLTVKIAGFIYSFAYPKEFHPQIKNLVKILEWSYS